jgi:hypothetical protein
MRDQYNNRVNRSTPTIEARGHSIPVRHVPPTNTTATGSNASPAAPESNQNTLGKLATKHTSKVKNKGLIRKIFTSISRVLSLVKRASLKLLSLLKPLLRKLWKILRPLPWKKIIPSFVVVLVLLFSIFHFYLASPTRITAVIESNYVSSQVLEEELIKSGKIVEQIPAFSTDVQKAESALFTISKTAQTSSLSLPPRFFTSYAFRNDDGLDAQIDTLYSANTNINLSELQRTSLETSQLITVSRDFFERDISKNTQSYITFVKDIKKQLDELIQSESALDLNTLQRIFQQVLNSAEQYEITQDLDNFNQQTNNVTSEIYKVIYQSWDDYSSSVQENLSTFRSSTESIINY